VKNDELEKIRKEAVVAYNLAFTWRDWGKTTRNLCHDSPG
jgi:hypothetical protein